MKHDRRLIIPSAIEGDVRVHEIAAAQSLADYFDSTVLFIVPALGYKMKSSDVIVNGVDWEIKSPTGASKVTTIQKQFKGLRQSKNLLIDGRRLGLSDTFAITKIQQELKLRKSVKRLLYIQKTGKIVDCMAKKQYNKK